MELDIRTREEGGSIVVEVSGEIDPYTAPRLGERFEQLTTGPVRLVVDLQGVDFIDSTGFGVLVGALHRAQASDGEFVLVTDQERVLKVLRITGLDRVFPIHASLAGALAAGS